MLKTGICTIQQTKEPANFKTWLGGEKKLSITLYDAIQHLPNADELAERILLLFADERGAYKRTYTNRFAEFDQTVLANIKNIFNTHNQLALHDIGVSDGRTALDFFDKITVDFPGIKYIASDYNPKVYLLEQGNCKVTVSHNNKVLEVTYPPFVFNKIKRDRLLYALNHIIYYLVKLFVVNPMLKKYQAHQLPAKELLLFAPKVLQTAKNDPRFILKQYNLLEPLSETTDIIRAMNVLNPSYFSESEFSKLLKNIYNGLTNNGLLITGSNQEAGTLVHGGIYQKTSTGFNKIYQSGNGSPIDTNISQLCI